MANDQMPNYGIQTQRKIITTDRTALFISKMSTTKSKQRGDDKEIREEKKRDTGREEKR